jgi:hypothetical protein
MHDRFGWGEEFLRPIIRKKPGIFERLWRKLFG